MFASDESDHAVFRVKRGNIPFTEEPGAGEKRRRERLLLDLPNGGKLTFWGKSEGGSVYSLLLSSDESNMGRIRSGTSMFSAFTFSNCLRPSSVRLK